MLSSAYSQHYKPFVGRSLIDLAHDVRELLSIADKFNGVCYGNYVRDVVAPLIACRNPYEDILEPIMIKSVKIWFKSLTDLNSAIVVLSPVGDVKQETGRKYWSDKKSTTVFRLKDLIRVDLVYSELPPKSKLFSGIITYNLKKATVSFPPEFDVANKKIHLTHEVESLPRAEYTKLRRDVMKYEQRGWTIIYQPNIPTSVKSEDRYDSMEDFVTALSRYEGKRSPTPTSTASRPTSTPTTSTPTTSTSTSITLLLADSSGVVLNLLVDSVSNVKLTGFDDCTLSITKH